MLSLFKILRLQFRTEGVHVFHFCIFMYVSVMLLLWLVVSADVPLQTVFTTWTGNFPVSEVTFSHWFLGPDATVVTLTRTCYPLGEDFFFILTLFKTNFKSNTSVFFKLTFFVASIPLPRPNACAAPCMVARQAADMATTGIADR